MPGPLSASSPEINAVVAASAGTGKTWLLVTRIMRLLLKGVAPEHILAITFTRKAAAEMQLRLSQRLLEFAQCDKTALIKSLKYIGVETTDDTVQLSQHLYENLLCNPQTVKTNTFHSFCQDILRKFPLEADIPPGFELLEQSNEMQQNAIDALFNEATHNPKSDIATALELLFDTLNGLGNTRTALTEFLSHRGDWWAYTRNQADCVEFSVDLLSRQFSVTPDEDPLQQFYQSVTTSIGEFAELLRLHPNKSNDLHQQLLENNINLSKISNDNFTAIKTVFLTEKNLPRARKPSATLEKKMGSARSARFIELHLDLAEQTLHCLDIIARKETLAINSAWYLAGNRLINIYQQSKEEQRLLDFTDLEWKTFALLSDSENSQWIQYKLDQRIEHILIDEFQDTNPTQWQLLLPLLTEMSAGENERLRSVFLVGDQKQSIYRFRRAEPRLFNTATQWLTQHLAAKSFPQDQSRRSSPAIMDFVNAVFGDGPLHESLGEFHPHTTTLNDVWGRVELLPLIEDVELKEVEQTDTSLASDTEFRNPLKMARAINSKSRYYREGELIADRIHALITDRTIITKESITKENKHHYLRYSDIFILVQTRTHVKDIEAALRVNQIPYLSVNRGTLLECIEVRDVIALLNTLIAPYNNLSLATTLKCPLFNCSDDDLMLLASATTTAKPEHSWYGRLQTVAINLPTEHPLARAKHWLSHWRFLTGQLPAHDLLDKIYSQGNLIARFESAFPSHLKQRVRANLTRFIELALEVDSGRYPSLSHFLSRLRYAKTNEQEAPDEGQLNVDNDCVRILTIHSSKGLEAPVIFIADAESVKTQKSAYHALVEWPPESIQPDCFFIMGPKEKHDSVTKIKFNQHLIAENRENANLLYVAITRARQLLFISGCSSKKQSTPGWHKLIRRQLELHNSTASSETDSGTDYNILEFGEMPVSVEDIATDQQKITVSIDPRLKQPFDDKEYNINKTAQTPGQADSLKDIKKNDDAKLRGIIIHRMLELFSMGQYEDNEVIVSKLVKKVAREYALSFQDELIIQCSTEALTVFTHTAFSYLFDSSQFIKAYNEVPIAYRVHNSIINGVIDRLVICEKEVYIVDYKTHRGLATELVDKFAEGYTKQMASYRDGIRQMWPDKKINALILFTGLKQICQLPLLPHITPPPLKKGN